MALKEAVEEVDWSHNTFGDLFEAAKEVLDDDEDVGEVVRQAQVGYSVSVVPAQFLELKMLQNWDSISTQLRGFITKKYKNFGQCPILGGGSVNFILQKYTNFNLDLKFSKMSESKLSLRQE